MNLNPRWTVLFLLAISAALTSLQASSRDEAYSLAGSWQFQFDPKDAGQKNQWYLPNTERSGWRQVAVPHTWQVEPGNEDYMGIAWYARAVPPEPGWQKKDLRLEFDAVYRDAQVWVNGQFLGEHLGSGYTPFGWPVNSLWNHGKTNLVVVRVDNRFSTLALPYTNSFDWPADGGLVRGVRIRIRPTSHIQQVLVDAKPDANGQVAGVHARLVLNAPTRSASDLKLTARLYHPSGGLAGVAEGKMAARSVTKLECRVEFQVDRPELWHFDYPRLYRLVSSLTRGREVVHETETLFGIRSLEVKEGRFVLNGEPMRLMGVEWMPASDPRYGLAEDPYLMREILTDMKRLNCVLTRFHWQQDEAVFDFCDREGMLVQEEVPSWGGDTMKGKLEDIQERHLVEMILPHYNHPSIYAWGLCNEIGGQSQAAHAFVQRGRRLARALDPHRPLVYASNSLQSNPEKDASQYLDFIEWNDYYQSWYGGTLEDMTANLKRIQEAFPGKGIVISEYGLCECNPKNPVGDARRIEILREHTARYRQSPAVAGAIFFSYNDYRTHMGDKGQGAFQQRVHGVVDLLGRRKPSWEALRRESSPVRVLKITPPVIEQGTARARVELTTRSLENDFPSYTLRGYWLHYTAYNLEHQPIGTGKLLLPDLAPGAHFATDVTWPSFPDLARVMVEIFRPNGYSVLDADWKK